MQFHPKSARGLVKIIRCGRDDSVGTRIAVILMGVAVWLHARGARRWGSLGACPKRVVFRHEGPVFYGVVPERWLFRARVWTQFALKSPIIRSEDEICRGEEEFSSNLSHRNLSLIRFH